MSFAIFFFGFWLFGFMSGFGFSGLFYIDIYGDYTIFKLNELNGNINEIDSNHNSYQECIKNIDDNKKEDIIHEFMSNLDECWIVSNYSEEFFEEQNYTSGHYENQIRYSPCKVNADFWSDFSTSIMIDMDKSDG